MSEHGISIDDIKNLDLEDFDAAEYLTSDEAMAAYLTDIYQLPPLFGPSHSVLRRNITISDGGFWKSDMEIPLGYE